MQLNTLICVSWLNYTNSMKKIINSLLLFAISHFALGQMPKINLLVET